MLLWSKFGPETIPSHHVQLNIWWRIVFFPLVQVKNLRTMLLKWGYCTVQHLLHVVWDSEFFNVFILFCTYKCAFCNVFIHSDFPKRPQALNCGAYWPSESLLASAGFVHGVMQEMQHNNLFLLQTYFIRSFLFPLCIDYRYLFHPSVFCSTTDYLHVNIRNFICVVFLYTLSV